MQILFVASEVYPFSKTGGLADVAGALPQALVRLGHEVLVVSPWYRNLAADPAPLWIGDVFVPFAGGACACGVGTLERGGVRYAFVGHEDFRRDRIYGYDDDARRFARFARAVPRVAARTGFMPDLVHAHDWHSAYLPMLLQRGRQLPEGFARLPSAFTVHNVQYQGVSDLAQTLLWLGLPGELGDGDMNQGGAANAMKAGIGYAQAVTTVSPTYAEEIQTPAGGFGLDGAFRRAASRLTGILNGLDTEVWSPETDASLAQTYGAASLSGKQATKAAICSRFGLEPNRPLLASVSRLADQKGIDILLAAVPELLEQGWNLFLLGSGDPALEAAARALAARSPGRAGAFIGFDESLAHQVYAAADALVVPSRFEPCGLSQMIAMRYGTLPIARATGGLKDTICPGRTGFLFQDATAASLLETAHSALQAFGDEPRWREMMVAAMHEDFSWERSARAYVDVFEGASAA